MKFILGLIAASSPSSQLLRLRLEVDRETTAEGKGVPYVRILELMCVRKNIEHGTFAAARYQQRPEIVQWRHTPKYRTVTLYTAHNPTLCDGFRDRHRALFYILTQHT